MFVRQTLNLLRTEISLEKNESNIAYKRSHKWGVRQTNCTFLPYLMFVLAFIAVCEAVPDPEAGRVVTTETAADTWF